MDTKGKRKTKDELKYEKALKRIDELLQRITNETPETDKGYRELLELSDFVESYERQHGFTFSR